MLLKIVSLAGEEKTVDVEPIDTIWTVKERLEEQEGIPPEQQRLVYQGKQLKNDRTVQSYNIKGGSVLHVLVALRGGILNPKLHPFLFNPRNK